MNGANYIILVIVLRGGISLNVIAGVQLISDAAEVMLLVQEKVDEILAQTSHTV